MKEPNLATRVLGHPVIAAPLCVGGLALLFGCWQAGGDGVIPGIATLVVLSGVAKASERMSAYRAWRRAWDGMAESGGNAAGWKKPLGVVLVALMVLYMASQAGRPEYQFALGWMAVLGIGAAVVWLWRRKPVPASRRSAVRDDPVKISARAPSSAPPLDAAYHALPEYCRRILGGGHEPK